MKVMKTIALISCLIFVAGCHKHNTLSDHTHNHEKNNQSYQKPGANIRLSHNYDGQTALGESENIQLIFSEQYASGQLNIRLKPDTALLLEPATEDFVFSLADGNTHLIELAVSTISSGKHLLNIFASVRDETGRISNRILAIAFYVGDEHSAQDKTQAPSSNESVIVLPSQERNY